MSNASHLPVTPGDTGDHAAKLAAALARHDLTPDAFRWHYMQMVFKANNRVVTQTARQLGVHRRTLQRMLAKREPKTRVGP